MKGSGSDKTIGAWQVTCKVHDAVKTKKGYTYCTRTRGMKHGGLDACKAWAERAHLYPDKSEHQKDEKAPEKKDEKKDGDPGGEHGSSNSSSSSSSSSVSSSSNS